MSEMPSKQRRSIGTNARGWREPGPRPLSLGGSNPRSHQNRHSGASDDTVAPRQPPPAKSAKLRAPVNVAVAANRLHKTMGTGNGVPRGDAEAKQGPSIRLSTSVAVAATRLRAVSSGSPSNTTTDVPSSRLMGHATAVASMKRLSSIKALGKDSLVASLQEQLAAAKQTIRDLRAPAEAGRRSSLQHMSRQLAVECLGKLHQSTCFTTAPDISVVAVFDADGFPTSDQRRVALQFCSSGGSILSQTSFVDAENATWNELHTL